MIANWTVQNWIGAVGLVACTAWVVAVVGVAVASRVVWTKPVDLVSPRRAVVIAEMIVLATLGLILVTQIAGG